MSRQIKADSNMDKSIRLLGIFWLGLVVIIYASGCSALSSRAPEQSTIFLPPTQAISPTPLPGTLVIQHTPSPETDNFIPTATPTCVDGLTFIEDLTIPDGQVVAPGEVLDKRWQVQNSGTCNWDDGYTIQHIAGPELGVLGIFALYPARSGEEAVLRIEFIAPTEPGTYLSAWQAYNPQGVAFGDPFYIEFAVTP